VNPEPHRKDPQLRCLSMVEPSVIREMLDELRFGEAENLVGDSDSVSDQELRAEIARRRDEAEKRAAELAGQIIELGENESLEEVLELAKDPALDQLLSLVAESSHKRAALYLREAKRWAERRVEVNVRRLGEARRALDGLDLDLARGLMRRIDGRFLSDDHQEERDQLLLDISARAMEVESLEEKGRRMIDENPPRGGRRDGKGWWRRRFN